MSELFGGRISVPIVNLEGSKKRETPSWNQRRICISVSRLYNFHCAIIIFIRLQFQRNITMRTRSHNYGVPVTNSLYDHLRRQEPTQSRALHPRRFQTGFTEFGAEPSLAEPKRHTPYGLQPFQFKPNFIPPPRNRSLLNFNNHSWNKGNPREQKVISQSVIAPKTLRF